jgi:hypothetical protein
MEARKEPGFFEKLMNLFISPRETFEALDRKPTWLVPFLVTILILFGGKFLMKDVLMKDMLAWVQASNMPEAQKQAFSSAPSGVIIYSQIIFQALLALIFLYLICPAVLLFTGNTVLGGNSRFKKVFSVVSWSSLVFALGTIVNTALVLVNGTMMGVNTSLALVLATPEPGKRPSFLYMMLTQFDLFTLWQMALWTIGLGVIYKFSIKKSAGTVIVLFLVWILLFAAISMLSPGGR